MTTNTQQDNGLLSLTDVHTHIGMYHILHGVNLRIPQGKVSMLLGRNGVGKTTCLRTIMGLWRASSGEIVFNQQPLNRTNYQMRTPDIASLGIGYVPEGMGIFAGLSVQENMLLAAKQAKHVKEIDTQRLEWLFSYFPALKKFWLYPAGKLSGGQKQMLAIARAVIEPKQLVILDEPSKGLAPAIVQNMIELFKALAAQGTTLLMVEQNFSVAEQVGDHVAVMDHGRIVYQNTMAALIADEDQQHALLGFSMEHH